MSVNPTDVERALNLAKTLEAKVSEIEARMEKLIHKLNHGNELAEAMLDKLERAETGDFE
jgi:hypothetical protein